MTTHEVADALIHLGKALKKLPDVPLQSINLRAGGEDQMFFESGRFRPEQAGAALSDCQRLQTSVNATGKT